MASYLLILTFIGLSTGLAWFLLSKDRGEKEPIDALWLAVGLGIISAFLAIFLERRLVNSDYLLTGMPYGGMFITALSIGLIEELCKFGPITAFIYKKRYFNEHTDGIIYYALAGLGFGLPENIFYTLQYGTKTGFARLILTPLFHAATTGVVGYFLIKRKLAGKSFFGIILPLTAVALLHGLYDFGLAAGTTFSNAVALLITLGLSAGLFILFLRATELDQNSGASQVGHNNFCRSCGWANPKHNLYCTHCGKNA